MIKLYTSSKKNETIPGLTVECLLRPGTVSQSVMTQRLEVPKMEALLLRKMVCEAIYPSLCKGDPHPQYSVPPF